LKYHGSRVQKQMCAVDITELAVDVTYLRLARGLEDKSFDDCGITSVLLATPDVPFYRYLHNTVGQPYLWWSLRLKTDEELSSLLSSKTATVYTLYHGGRPIGFFELSLVSLPVAEVVWFGLVPSAVGKGFGKAALEFAMRAAWTHGASEVQLHTCTADHPGALPNYLKAGFRPVRTATEYWSLPNRLGFQIPAKLILPSAARGAHAPSIKGG